MRSSGLSITKTLALLGIPLGKPSESISKLRSFKSFFLPSSSSPGVEVSSCGGCSVLHVRILLFVLIIIVGRPNRRRYRYYTLSPHTSPQLSFLFLVEAVFVFVFTYYLEYIYIPISSDFSFFRFEISELPSFLFPFLLAVGHTV